MFLLVSLRLHSEQRLSSTSVDRDAREIDGYCQIAEGDLAWLDIGIDDAVLMSALALLALVGLTAPVATVGNLFVVASDKVQRIDASVADTVAVITQCGVDAAQLYGGRAESGGDTLQEATGPARQPADQV